MTTINIRGPYHLEPVTPERKGFIIASSILLVIELAGGHFVGGVTPFGGLRLERPELLHLFVWFYFFFQTLRYWQSIGHPSIGYFSVVYQRQVDLQMFNNPAYKELLESLLSTTAYTLGQDAPKFPLIHRTLFQRYINFRRGWHHPSEKYPDEENLPIFKVKLRKLAAMEARAHYRIIFFESFWFDAVFPWGLAIVAITVGFINNLI